MFLKRFLGLLTAVHFNNAEIRQAGEGVLNKLAAIYKVIEVFIHRMEYWLYSEVDVQKLILVMAVVVRT